MITRTRKYLLAFASTLFLVICGSHASAGWMADRYLDIDKILRTMPKVAIPLQDHIDIVTGKKTSDRTIRVFLEGPAKEAASIAVSTQTIQDADPDSFDRRVEEFGDNHDRVLLETSSGNQSEQTEFTFTAEGSGAALLRIKDPILSLSMPLAMAIREARAKLSANARPIPTELAKYLLPIIPKKILERVRYTVGNVKISIPAAIDKSGLLFGEDEAIVLDDLIVFSREPILDNPEDVKWWVHELQHVYQFTNWGVDLFAYRYTKHASRVESEAGQAASYVMSFGSQLGGDAPVEPKVSFANVLHAKPIELMTPLGKTTVYQKSNLDEFSGPARNIASSELCIFNGDYLVISENGVAFSLSQGGSVIGTRMNSRSPVNCEFDLRTKGTESRFCIQRRSRLILPDNPPFHVGQCQKCKSQPCF